MNESDYAALDFYRRDLAGRVEARDAWRERHPDHDTTAYRAAELRYEQTLIVSADTTFRPDDPEPETRDVLSVDTFLRVLNVALAAYEKAYGVES
jgi:hypothetical protein